MADTYGLNIQTWAHPDGRKTVLIEEKEFYRSSPLERFIFLDDALPNARALTVSEDDNLFTKDWDD